MVEQANGMHKTASSLLAQSLDKAREAGELLMEAKRRVPYKRWTTFLRKHFVSSVETARVYMRVARKWNDPRIVDSKLGKMSPTSIKGFLDIVSNKPKSPDDQPTPVADVKAAEKDAMRQELRQSFGELLKRLDRTELKVLEEHFDDLADRLHGRLRELVCITLEFDYYLDRWWINHRYKQGDITEQERDRLREESEAEEKSKRRRSPAFRARERKEQAEVEPASFGLWD